MFSAAYNYVDSRLSSQLTVITENAALSESLLAHIKYVARLREITCKRERNKLRITSQLAYRNAYVRL